MCPGDIDPWNPSAPGNACSIEGATCSSDGGGGCGGGTFCTCRTGRWDCLIAEPDPACWCGREPSIGDACSTEGESCGACCPTAGEWSMYQCQDGHWTVGVCPAIECPVPLACPVDTASVLGTPCEASGASCGDSCCDTAIVCEGGTWLNGPSADCLTCASFSCGGGLCNPSQYCNSFCGPDDGIDYDCQPLPVDCSSCDCVPLWGTQTCEMIDGHPHVRELGFCA